MEKLWIDTSYITLGQALKMVNLISSGGMAKWYLSENIVYLNGEEENRRGKKLYHDDVVLLPSYGKIKIQSKVK